MIKNRIEKNIKKLAPWAHKNNIEAYRIYDRDIPEFPFIIDRYGSYVLIYDKTEEIDAGKSKDQIVFQAIKEILNLNEDFIILKKRFRQTEEQKYQKLGAAHKKIIVKENGVSVYVNLWDYLDTGLFIDHRPLRYYMLKKTKGLRILNLFSYTCVVSLMAAVGGAQTVSVDLSANYLNWGKENFNLNQINMNDHKFIEQNALTFLKDASEWPDYKQNFDLVFLDPPTFSNSKSMEQDFEVERDQKFIIQQAMKFLKPEGKLLFSTNKRKFKLDQEVQELFKVTVTTEKTIPVDCFDQKIHHSYEIIHHKKNL